MILAITPNPAIDNVYFVEKLEVGEVNRPVEKTRTAGGKGLNVARVSSLIGEKVGAGGFLGGYNGEFIRSEVKKLGIRDEFTQIKENTRDCVNMTDKSTGKSTEILEKGPIVSVDEVNDFFNNYANVCRNYDIISVSGSLPLGVSKIFFNKMISISKENNKKIIVDTSGEGLKIAIEAKAYMIKPNKFELTEYFRREISIKDALREFYNSGIELPIVSLGKDGCMTYVDSKFYTFTTPDIKVVNTVGSGDSFIAGCCTGFSRGYNEIDSIKLGMACGTANTQFSATGMVSKELVDKFFSEITVK